MFKHPISYITFYFHRITLYKVLNLGTLVVSFAVSLLFRKPYVWGKPAFISVEPTNICNLHCPECPTGGGFSNVKKGYLTKEIVEALEYSLKKSILHVNLFFQGEPYLNKNIIEITPLISKYTSVTVSTNGHFITQENVDAIVTSGLYKIIISVDGINQEQYLRYRVGGDFEKVTEAVRLLKQAKGSAVFPILEMQCLLFNYTETIKSEYIKLAQTLGADTVQFKTAQFYNTDEAKKYLPSDENSRYTVNDSTIELKRDIKNRCWRMWTGTVITWNGDVVPCCFDKDKTFVMGNVVATQLFDIWKHLSYRKFRKVIFKKRKKITMCTNCTEF